MYNPKLLTFATVACAAAAFALPSAALAGDDITGPVNPVLSDTTQTQDNDVNIDKSKENVGNKHININKPSDDDVTITKTSDDDGTDVDNTNTSGSTSNPATTVSTTSNVTFSPGAIGAGIAQGTGAAASVGGSATGGAAAGGATTPSTAVAGAAQAPASASTLTVRTVPVTRAAGGNLPFTGPGNLVLTALLGLASIVGGGLLKLVPGRSS